MKNRTISWLEIRKTKEVISLKELKPGKRKFEFLFLNTPPFVMELLFISSYS